MKPNWTKILLATTLLQAIYIASMHINIGIDEVTNSIVISFNK